MITARILSVLGVLCPLAAQSAPPNIIVILADDLGWGDVSCNQPDGKVQTPAIDALAAKGMRFTNAQPLGGRK